MKSVTAVLLLSILAIAILEGSADPQTHATLPEQCKADYRLWQLGMIGGKVGLDKLPFGELNQREVEMWNCAAVDQTGSADYLSLSMAYGLAMSKRYEAFLQRHGEMQTFLDEDRAATVK